MTPAAAVRVLVMPAAGAASLAVTLGPERAAAVGAVLRARALAWARDASPSAPLEAAVGESLAQAAERAFAAGPSEPLLIAWPDLPVWREEHRAAALADLADGCGVAVGPVFDGGFYLLALAAPLLGLLELSSEPDAMNRAFRAAHEAEVGVGLLRPERGLRSAADVAAALADPLLDGELRGLLG